MFNYIERQADGSFIPKRANYRSPRFVADIPEDIETKYYNHLQVKEVIKTNEVTGGKYKEYEVSLPEEVKNKVDEQEKQKNIDTAKSRLRMERISILDATDKIVTVPDFPVSQENKQLYVEYRAYVRLINDTLTDEEIVDYKLMSFEEWKKHV